MSNKINIKFELLDKENYVFTKFKVRIETHIPQHDTAILKEEKNFKTIDEVGDYIRAKKEEMIKYPELYPYITEIYLEIIKTDSQKFRVVNN